MKRERSWAAVLLAVALLVGCCTSITTRGAILRDPGFDATWRARNLTEAQLRWHPFVNGFRPSVNPKLGGTAALAVSPRWPSGAFQFVPGDALPSDVKQYSFSVWVLVEDLDRQHPVPRHMGNITIDVSYVGGGSDSFNAPIISNGHSGHAYAYQDEGAESDQNLAAERFTVWREEWQQLCYSFKVAPDVAVESIVIYFLSSKVKLSKPGSLQLWADQASLHPSHVSELSCAPLSPITSFRRPMAERYQIDESVYQATYIASTSDITLVVHLDQDQLPALNPLAASWNGPISASVLLRNREGLAGLSDSKWMDLNAKKWITLHALYPLNDKEAPHIGYPSGVLRRVATQAASTSNVLQFDINFLVMPRLREILETYVGSHDLEKQILVLPAYAAHDPTDTAPANEEILLEKLRKGELHQVRSKINLRPDLVQVSPRTLRAPLMVISKALSRVDDTIEGACGIDLDQMKTVLAMEDYVFTVLPRGYSMRTAPEPRHERECFPTPDLRPWRTWYAWLISASIKHGVSPEPYYHTKIEEPYARGRGVVGVVTLMLEREPFFLWLFLGCSVLVPLLIYGRKLRERHEQPRPSLLPMTWKGE